MGGGIRPPHIFVIIMMCSKNSKYLHKKFEDEQNKCFMDKDHYTASEQAFYEVGTSGHVEDRNNAFIINVKPVDPSVSDKKLVDLRKRPESGD